MTQQEVTPLRIIVGATASGKESLALACARRLDGEIVSVDSMKVYRGLDVATAKPGAADRAAVPHHCLDLVEPTESFSAADFVRTAEAAIQSIQERGRPVFLSGGTAFYYRALLEGLFDGPAAEPELRRSLEERAAAEGPEALHRRLTELDPDAAAKIHPSDVRRLVRALEVISLTGEPISRQRTQWAAFHSDNDAERRAGFFASPRHPFVMLRIVRDRADLHTRVAERITRMERAGLEGEARRVWERRDEMSRTVLQAVGYKELFPYFAGEAAWPAALERLRLATNRLVRSQETWFRKFPATVVALAPDDDPETVADNLCRTVFDCRAAGHENNM